MENSSVEIARRWADIVIERWIRKVNALQVYDTGELLKSFEAQVMADSNGNPEKVTFLFLYYGKFPDMGVGRGVKLGDERGNRQKKPWYSSVFLKEVYALGRLLAEKYGVDAAQIPLRAFQGIETHGRTDSKIGMNFKL